MHLYSIDTGFFKLDGGAMFGVVPKSIWKSKNPPDARNMCTWAMRCLLIESGKRLVLIDTGIGNKQGEKFRSHFEPHGDATLKKSLKKLGFTPADVTDVILTHLHFDHCGGAVEINRKGKAVPTFPNATYWTSIKQWDWALDPNPRERASFLQENILPLQEHGVLKFVEDADPGVRGLWLEYVFGHTESMMVCHIEGYKDKTISYVADLIPSSHHIGLPYVMSYDVRPLETMREKAVVLERAIENDHILMFEHDPVVECCSLKRTERGIVFDETFALSDI